MAKRQASTERFRLQPLKLPDAMDRYATLSTGSFTMGGSGGRDLSPGRSQTSRRPGLLKITELTPRDQAWVDDYKRRTLAARRSIEDGALPLPVPPPPAETGPCGGGEGPSLSPASRRVDAQISLSESSAAEPASPTAGATVLGEGRGRPEPLLRGLPSSSREVLRSSRNPHPCTEFGRSIHPSRPLPSQPP